jgi:hypothetical protein
LRSGVAVPCDWFAVPLEHAATMTMRQSPDCPDSHHRLPPLLCSSAALPPSFPQRRQGFPRCQRQGRGSDCPSFWPAVQGSVVDRQHPPPQQGRHGARALPRYHHRRKGIRLQLQARSARHFRRHPGHQRMDGNFANHGRGVSRPQRNSHTASPPILPSLAERAAARPAPIARAKVNYSRLPSLSVFVCLRVCSDKYEVTIPSNLAYGARGAGGLIAPNSVLVFTIELLGIEGRDL